MFWNNISNVFRDKLLQTKNSSMVPTGTEDIKADEQQDECPNKVESLFSERIKRDLVRRLKSKGIQISQVNIQFDSDRLKLKAYMEEY